jgi:hypothetical protein
MDPILTLFLTFLIGFGSSFIGAISGGGGLISIPFLVFLGLPPQIAIATNKMGSIGLSIGSLARFWKSKHIKWKYVPVLTALGLAGGILGSYLLISLNEKILGTIMGIIILAILGIMLTKRTFGEVHKERPVLLKILGCIVYFFVMIYGGFFGGGGGILIFYTLIFFLGFTLLEANATDIIPWLSMSIVSFIIFAIHGLIDYRLGITLMIGMILGGYAGAHTAIKKGNRWVKMVFIFIVIASAVKLIFF